MRIVLSWEEFKMFELLFIHLKEDAFNKEKGVVKAADYEISWNPKVVIIDLKGETLAERVLFSLDEAREPQKFE